MKKDVCQSTKEKEKIPYVISEVMMISAARVLTFEKVNTLAADIALSPQLEEKRRTYLYDVLSSFGISSLSEVSLDTYYEYQWQAKRDFWFIPGKYRYYRCALEVAMVNFKRADDTGFFPEPDGTHSDRFSHQKMAGFLAALGIKDPSGITGDVRVSYEEYIETFYPEKLTEYTKYLDRIKIEAIEHETFDRKPIYENKIFYLAYYPTYDIASFFYYTARKEFLFFDFSVDALEIMKRQIFSYLVHIVENKGDMRRHYLLEHYITPLWYLYRYCIKRRIGNLLYITKPDVSAFPAYLENTMDAISHTASQVMHRIRKYLFLRAELPDFDATAWFLDRFTLDPLRINPTRPIEAFYFDDILDPGHRRYVQGYMRYLLVLSPKYSLTYILKKYYHVKHFIAYLEKSDIRLDAMSTDTLSDYVESLDKDDIRPETFNDELTDLHSFFRNIKLREKLIIPHFPFEYYYKKEVPHHVDRSVPEEEIDLILSVLGDFPEYLRLMYLTLYATGLRINEVCVIRKDAYSYDNGTYWLIVYQNKMKTEKMIPIPEDLYMLTMDYLDRTNFTSVYVFPSLKDKDKPFNAGTFTKKMKQYLKQCGITADIDFRSHDYRHTIISDIYYSGASIQTAREFAGHKYEDMTKQYIDHLPGRIDELQKEYFKEDK